MKNKGTPGPWRAVTGGDTHPNVVGPDGKSILSTSNSRATAHLEKCANAELAAKAPLFRDLLLDVRAHLESMPSCAGCSSLLGRIRSAVAK